MSRLTVIVILCLLLGIPFLQFVYAGDLSSSNFTVRGSIIDSSGGVATSSSFEQVSAIGDVAFGESTSTNFTLQSGPLYMNPYTPRGENWRWYGDETSETPTSALAAENTAPTGVDNRDIIKLRMTVKDIGGIAGANVKFKLQFSQSSTFASGVTDVVATGSCGNTSLWCYADGSGVDNATNTSKVLSDADSCSASVGNGCGSHNETGTVASTFTQVANAATEYEFTIKNYGAAYDGVYYFRLYDTVAGQAVTTDTGKTYPSLTAKRTTLTFTIGGLASGVTTAGTTTTFATTDTSVPFGQIATTTEALGAQRLTVTTNANYGYTVYLNESQQLQSAIYTTTIDKVSGTNASPAAFAIQGGSNGAYGYQTSDSSLGTGTTDRFSAANKFAQLDSTLREVAYSTDPVTSEATDIVYKLKVGDLQEAGNYTTTLTYVATPVF